MLYTKTGDKGMTSLVGGQRVPKNSIRLESYGTIDELNSFIGLLIAEVTDERDLETLKGIQSKLFTIGAYLATDHTQEMDYVVESGITEVTITEIEREIDRLDSQVPRMTAFVLPSGNRPTATAHLCRVVSRRAERRIYSLVDSGVEIETMLLKYVNRLSDYFFILARNLARQGGAEEVTWSGSCK